jgi:predicted MFS family arabinose efflux permease
VPPATATVPTVVDRGTWRGRALVPVLVYVGMLVAVVSSLGSPLVPTIAQDYGVSLGSAQWSLTLTLLVGAVVSPVVGRLGDGPRRLQVLVGSLGILTVGSVLAALPGLGFAFLLVGRGMQGVGLALLPLAMSVARDHLDPARSRSTLAVLSVTAVVGVGLGYPITGVIAEHLSFHAGFWLAAVLGLLAMALATVVVPSSSHRSSQHFDLPGALLLGAGLGGLLVSLSEGEEWGWASPALLGLVVASVVALGTFVWHELRTATPLVNLRLMRHRTVLTANVTGVLAGVGMYMLLSMIVRYVQTPASTGYGLGASVVVAGLALLPMSAASFATSKLVAWLSRWFSAEQLLPLGVVTFIAGLLLFATHRDHLWQILVVMAIVGFSIGASFAVMPRMIMASTPLAETSSALALNQVLRTVGYSIGSALSATVLTAHTAAGAVFPANTGYTVAAVIAMVLLGGTAVLSFVLPRRSAASEQLDTEAELLAEDNADAAIAGVLTLEYEPADAVR